MRRSSRAIEDHPQDRWRPALTTPQDSERTTFGSAKKSHTSWHHEVPENSVPSASGFRVQPASLIGDFRMVRILGRGGMGEVWEAEQVSLKRRVALKLLLPERVDEKGLEYFAREARAGARLTHRGIVAVHGSGQDEGLHWIAMEYVPEACDLRHAIEAFREETELPADYYPHVAQLVREIAEALQAAHDSGVIHRDLKPANILIGHDDQPRVTDFGLAKVTDEAALSVTGEVAGTYYYMSPEQVVGKRMGLDHRTDIFSLGVILYELLTLVRPFQGDTTEQIAHKILLTEPSAPTELRSKVPEDLAVICGKAMEKNPVQRYETMAELASDLGRFLEGRAILARPPGPVERTRRWVGRHRVQATAIAAGAAALIVISALGITAFRNSELAKSRASELEVQALALESANVNLKKQTAESEAQRLRAEANEKEVRASLVRSEAIRSILKDTIRVSPALMGRSAASAYEDLFSARVESLALTEEQRASRIARFREDLELCSSTTAGHSMLIETIFEPLEQRLANKRPQDAQTEIEVRIVLADVYYHPLAMFDRSIEQRSAALKLIAETTGPESSIGISTRSNLAMALYQAGRTEEAAEIQEAALKSAVRVFGRDDIETEVMTSNLAQFLSKLGRFDDSIRMQRKALELREARNGPDHHDCLVLRNNLAGSLFRSGDLEGAESVLRDEIEIGAETLKVNPSLAAWTNRLLGTVLYQKGEFSEAESLLVDSIEVQEVHLGREHPHTYGAIRTLSALYQAQQRHVEAEPLIREYFLLRTRLDGQGTAKALAERQRLYLCLRAQGKDLEAGELAQDARPTVNSDRAYWHQLAAQAFFSGGRTEDGIDLQRDAIFLLREAHGVDDLKTLTARLVLAEALVATGSDGEAIRILQQIVPAFEAAGLTEDDDALSRALSARARAEGKK